MTSKAATSKAGATRKSRAAAKPKKSGTARKPATKKTAAGQSVLTRPKAVAARKAAGPKVPRFNGRSIKTPMDAEMSARTLALLHRGLREVLAILVAVVSILMLIALMTFHVSDPSWSHSGGYGQVRNACGIFGAWFADIVMFLFGYVAYLLPVALGVIGWNAFRDSREFTAPVLVFARLAGLVLLLITACGLADLHLFVHRGDLPIGTGGGGVLGTWVAGNMVRVINTLGTTLILLALFLGSITFITGVSWFSIVEKTGAYTLLAARNAKAWAMTTKERIADYLTYREARKLRQQQQLASDAAMFDLPDSELATAASAAVGQSAAGAGKRAKKVRTEKKDPVVMPPVVSPPAADVPAASASAKKDITISQRPATPAPVAPVMEEKQFQLFETGKITKPQSTGEIPPVNLLDEIENVRMGYSEESLQHLSGLLETKLAEFNVIIEVVEVHPGPVITRFEAMPAPGVKISKITGLAKDIARSLSVMSVRVVEVIPGKSTIGLEIPNEDREIVQLTEMLQSKLYQDTKSPLAIALGKDISGLPVVADLAKMPHLLVAGTTGSGKSVAVNALLVSLLYKATADQVRLILIDPKMLELNVYEGIPHLLAPVVTDMKEAANALRWCVGEMERRYKLMSALGVRNLKGFNAKVLQAIENGEPIKDPLWKPEESMETVAPDLEKLPAIVVVVDEFADMMMIVGKKVEELIARIAQKARAAGIHLVLATQRPSVDVITGLIKANIPTRIAFQVSSKIDSRTILDQQGAEALLGAGDMLYLPPGTGVPTRIHGAFVDDHEVHAVVADWKQRGAPQYIDEILNGDAGAEILLPGEQPEGEDQEFDVFYDEAVAFVTETRRASVSSVQRKFRIGYNRAARLVEQMEQSGVVSSQGHNGNREVLAAPAPKD